MKKYTITLMLTLMGMAGCKNNNTTVVGTAPNNVQKADTALVLGKLCGSGYTYTHINNFLLVTRNGKVVINSSAKDYRDVNVYDFPNVGDTVIVATDKNGDMSIIKNLTMENKIKAFTKQR